MMRSSPILRSISAGSSAANIAAGLGNGSMPGIIPPISAWNGDAVPDSAGGDSVCAGAADCGAEGATAPAVDPGIGIANGFHIRCMNAIASCAENGGAPPAGLLDSSLIDRRSFAACVRVVAVHRVGRARPVR